MKKIVGYLKNPARTILAICSKGRIKLLDDKTYLKIIFKEIMGYSLDLSAPKTFNEKLQWLKLYDRDPIYTTMVDKHLAKSYVAEKIGKEHLIPTLGVWDNFDEIDFDALPNQFVLKCTHDSGGLVVCRDKSTLDIPKSKKIIDASMKRNFYYVNREWPYKDIKPRVIAEKYMQSGTDRELTDYKFYCFNGEPHFLYISTGLEHHPTAKISFVTLNWEFAPYERQDYAGFKTLPPKPSQFDKMLNISRVLSANQKFLRVDLYEIDGQIYFSELTFTPAAGFMPFKNYEQDLAMGELLKLN